MAYSSLFKRDDVRVTQKYKGTTHKGIDLSRGVVRQPIYLPNRAVEGEVWKVLVGYTNSGVYYKDAPIVYVKHKDGSGSRYIHSALADVQVKVGDKLKPGDRICSTGTSGKATGDHLHFEWLKKYNDNTTHIDPEPIIMNDGSLLKIGDNVEITAQTNVRTSPSTSGRVTGIAGAGRVGKLHDGPRYGEGYEWWDVYFTDHNGWMANPGGTRLVKTTKNQTTLEPQIPQEPVIPPEETECEKEVRVLKEENNSLTEQLRTSKNEHKLALDRIFLLEENLEFREKELADLSVKYQIAEQKAKHLEVQYNEAVKELNELKEGRDTWINRLGDILHKLFNKDA